MKSLLSGILCLCCVCGFAQSQRNLLTKDNSVSSVAATLDQSDEWIGYPVYNDRSAWSKISEVLKKQIIAKANKALKYQYQFIPASAYLAYVKTGDRGVQERPYTQNLGAVQALALGELMEGKGRFVSHLIDGIQNLCAMQTWALSAHLGLQKSHKEGIIDSTDNIIDLGAGRTASVLAWTYYFLQTVIDKVRPGFSAKIVSEIERRIIEPYEFRTDFWWMALQSDRLVNNWNVWCNYNVLTCILLIERSPQRRAALVYKTMQSVDKFLNYYKEDGACEEGPSYWSEAGGNLYHYLQLLKEATNDKINIFTQPLVRKIAAYIYKVYIDKDYFVNFADAHPKVSPNAALVYDFGRAVGDDTMRSFGAWLAHKQRFPQGDMWDDVNFLFGQNEIRNYPPKQPLVSEVEYPQTQVAVARDQTGSSEGFYFAAKGGNNDESHNHNDIGSFILYYDGYPLLIDIGSGTYTAQTFSSKRYELFNTRSLNHNVPLINGTEQHAGGKFAASNFEYHSSPLEVKLSIGIERAYPDSASVTRWERGYTLNRGKDFVITDQFVLKNNNGRCVDDFITPVMPLKGKEGELLFDIDGKKISMHYDAQKLSYHLTTIELTDPALIGQWGNKLYRIEMTFDKHVLQGKNIITITK